MADFGYDVSDHCDVDPLFGTLDDFDALAPRRIGSGCKLILDYVPNHTSIEHPWFREQPERYLWADEVRTTGAALRRPRVERARRAASTTTPTWPSSRTSTGGNPDVPAAMLDVLRFWCERGADGFRIDALRQTVKDARAGATTLRTPTGARATTTTRADPAVHADGPIVQDVVAPAARQPSATTLLIGELYVPIERLVALLRVGARHAGELPPADHAVAAARRRGPGRALRGARCRDGAWPNWVLGNHDRPRVAARIGAARRATRRCCC